MKVLQLVPGISTSFGGPSVALIDLTRLLSQHGIDAMLVTTNIDPRGRLKVPLGVPVNQQGAKVTFYDISMQGRYAFSLQLTRALFQTIRQYDVLHIHWLYNYSPLIGAIAAGKAGVPYVWQPNGSLDPHLMKKNSWVKKLYLKILGNYVIRNASAIIFTSEMERRQACIDGIGVPTHIVPVGLDWAEYANLPPRGEFRKQFAEIGSRQMVLFLGRMSPQKGLDLLVQAFRNVVSSYPNVHLVIAGPDGEGYGVWVRRWIAEANLEGHVTLAGRIRDHLKLAAYVDSDVFVLPSYAENFGATVTEALACKRPVVITDRVNISDEIARAEAGIVVSCTAASVASGILKVLNDPPLAKTLAENGRELVIQKFTWDAVLGKLIPIYKELAKKR